MSSKQRFELTIRNDELQEIAVVKGSSPEEVRAKAAKKQATWEQRVQRNRAKQALEDMRTRAAMETDEAQSLIQEYESLLKSTLLVNDRINWKNLFDRSKFTPPNFTLDPPSLERISTEMEVPQQSWIEAVWSKRRESRLQAEQLALDEYSSQQQEFERQRQAFGNEVKILREAFTNRQREHNEEISRLRSEFESGQASAVERYMALVLERSSYPDGFEQEFNVDFDDASRTVVVDYFLPTPENTPQIKEYRFIQSRKVVEPREMNAREAQALYDNIVHQVTLRTIHEIFESDYPRHVQATVFNGWVNSVDRATGQDFTACIISCRADRETFEGFDLGRVDPKESIRSLKALIAGPLAQLAPVRPVMQINRDDRRYTEAREVLDELDSTQNLAEMPWEDFEHLVRELFAAIFGEDGGEVKVTQASRDGGVDAVAFDPSPIRGGKFVIQAKRYNSVVPVSAARDLYGTMINEGAVKGILVTTGYYGHDSREFVKDKPLELIDGANLVYLFQEHGHNVRINLRTKTS